jgi:hypothetical protein
MAWFAEDNDISRAFMSESPVMLVVDVDFTECRATFLAFTTALSENCLAEDCPFGRLNVGGILQAHAASRDASAFAGFLGSHRALSVSQRKPTQLVALLLRLLSLRYQIPFRHRTKSPLPPRSERRFEYSRAGNWSHLRLHTHRDTVTSYTGQLSAAPAPGNNLSGGTLRRESDTPQSMSTSAVMSLSTLT